ncbi:MAG: pseudouridine synthase, partial [Armatimonadetes bacterium]|nr:pseudouridine synthase [Anaerolineae bacterium]
MMKERIQKLMAQANIGSRRACEELIRQGRVRVNGVTAKLGDQADPALDTLHVDDELLKFTLEKRYFALNKPLNVVSSTVSQDERENVRDLLPYKGHLFTIGRLDADSDGLMVLTNDGNMANRLTHPRFQHTKTYKVVVYGTPVQTVLDTWEHGVYLEEEGLTLPCSIRVQSSEGDVTVLRIVMVEGKRRQIRRVAALLGHPVKRLTRTHIGQLQLGKLVPGEWVELSADDLKLLNTTASDVTYIRQLRREQRELRRQHFAFINEVSQPPIDETKRPGAHKPGRSDNRPGYATPRRPSRSLARPSAQDSDGDERPSRSSSRSSDRPAPRRADAGGSRPSRSGSAGFSAHRTGRPIPRREDAVDQRPSPFDEERPARSPRSGSGGRPPRRADTRASGDERPARFDDGRPTRAPR